MKDNAETGLLQVRDLSISFGRGRFAKAAVEGASFDVAPGRTLAIVGESGSGKSTSALAMMRLLPAKGTTITGTVSFNGRDLLAASEAEMRNIRGNEVGMIFQEPMTSLNPVLTVGDQICETLIRHRGMTEAEARDEAIALIEKVRIPSPAARFAEYPHRMSGGMRQRVMIAMAIACKPKLLIADEPTTALDVTVQAQILALLKTLQKEEGMAILFITHDLGVVAEIADDVCVMQNGKVVEAAPAADVLTAPQHPYTQKLLAAVPVFGALDGISRPVRFADGLPAAEPVKPEAPRTDAPVLSVEGLRTRFDIRKNMMGTVSGRIHAVENVSFDLYPGETLALVGESGCGKSTIGRSLLRLEAPQEGRVKLEGTDLLSLDAGALRAIRPKIQMVFQDPYGSLNPRLEIGRIIAEPLLVNGLASSRDASAIARRALEEVGLPADFTRRHPDQLSGGQRQRVCIARAMAFQPKVVVADEAVSALDASTKAAVVDLMIDLQEKTGLSYLFISHDIALVERMSHRVAVMYLGELVEIGTRQDVLMNPQHPYTKRLLSGVPVMDPARRHRPVEISNFELKSPVRPLDFTPPARSYTDHGNGHVVQDWGPEWN